MADIKRAGLAQIKIISMILAPLSLWTVILAILPYSATFDLVLKVILWGIPACLFPRWVDHVNAIEFLLINKPLRWKWVVLSVAFLIVYLALTNPGRLALKPVSFFYILSAIILSPVIEEIAFRGVILQKLSQMMRFAFANAATAILFLLYHIPVWLARGQGVSWMGCLWVLFFGAAIGYVLSRSKSLWTCIFIHAVQNLLFGVLL